MVKPSEKCNEYWQQSFRNIVSLPALTEEQRNIIDAIVYDVSNKNAKPYFMSEMNEEKMDAVLLTFIYLMDNMPFFRLGLFFPNYKDLQKMHKRVLDFCFDAKQKLQHDLVSQYQNGLLFSNSSSLIFSAAAENSNIEGLVLNLAFIDNYSRISKNVNEKIRQAICMTDGKIIKAG